jgi:hypothetical protein
VEVLRSRRRRTGRESILIGDLEAGPQIGPPASTNVYPCEDASRGQSAFKITVQVPLSPASRARSYSRPRGGTAAAKNAQGTRIADGSAAPQGRLSGFSHGRCADVSTEEHHVFRTRIDAARTIRARQSAGTLFPSLRQIFLSGDGLPTPASQSNQAGESSQKARQSRSGDRARHVAKVLITGTRTAGRLTIQAVRRIWVEDTRPWDLEPPDMRFRGHPPAYPARLRPRLHPRGIHGGLGVRLSARRFPC